MTRKAIIASLFIGFLIAFSNASNKDDLDPPAKLSEIMVNIDKVIKDYESADAKGKITNDNVINFYQKITDADESFWKYFLPNDGLEVDQKTVDENQNIPPELLEVTRRVRLELTEIDYPVSASRDTYFMDREYFIVDKLKATLEFKKKLVNREIEKLKINLDVLVKKYGPVKKSWGEWFRENLKFFLFLVLVIVGGVCYWVLIRCDEDDDDAEKNENEANSP